MISRDKTDEKWPTTMDRGSVSPVRRTSFSDLPNELLIMISNAVFPADLEAFTISSKRVYQLSARRRKNHRILKKRYTDVKVTWDPTTGVANPLSLLGEILLNQEHFVGHYIKTIDARHGDLTRDPVAGDIIRAFDGFHDLIQDLPMFRNNKALADELYGMLCNQDCDSLWMLLLAVLPEVESIQLEPDLVFQGHIEHAFRTLATVPKGNAPFARLSKVVCEIPPVHWNANARGVLPWFTIPSVREVRARHWVCTLDHLNLVQGWIQQRSNVTSIDFTDCILAPEALCQILKHVRLERFRYGEPYNQESRIWDVEPVVQALVDYQADSLKHLNMVGVPREAFEDAESTTQFKTLKPLKKLETFEGHITMLPKVRNGGHRIKRDLVVDLEDVVPSSLQVLGLVEKEGLQAPVVDFYPDFIALRNLSATPSLKTFTCVGIDLAKETRRALAAAGIWYKELETYKTASPLG